MAEWQPIETAPMDGTIVWIITDSIYDGGPGTIGLKPILCLASYHPDGGWTVDELRQATHWMPYQKGSK
jgi:hypothetical protein